MDPSFEMPTCADSRDRITRAGPLGGLAMRHPCAWAPRMRGGERVPHLLNSSVFKQFIECRKCTKYKMYFD